MHALFERYVTSEQELAQLEEDRFRVCIFGSARIRPSDPTFRMVRKLAKTLAMLGIDIVTGGGPGLMDAANHGEKDAHANGVLSIGLPIALPDRPEPANKHLDIKSEHSRFSTRLDEFMRLSHAVIVAPGGIGTLLELAYSWQLIQVHLLHPRPIVLLGREFWGGLLHWMQEQQVSRGFVSPPDMAVVHFADTEAEVLELICPALEQFRAERQQAGDRPKAEEASLMLEHADELRDSPEHQEPLPGAHTVGSGS
jgi:uncharacterized protein (TIGR00730 family)